MKGSKNRALQAKETADRDPEGRTSLAGLRRESELERDEEREKGGAWLPSGSHRPLVGFDF